MRLEAKHKARIRPSVWKTGLSSTSNRASSNKFYTSNNSLIQVGDRVLLQSRSKHGFLSKVLRPQGSTNLQHGHIKHAEIIGKRIRDTVMSSRGDEFRVYLPTLAEYVTLTPRLVTPIYPADANVIVSQLDIHIEGHASGPPSLEILEAGTGHGALTLYLARAIHGANTTHPKEGVADDSRDMGDDEPERAVHENGPDKDAVNSQVGQEGSISEHIRSYEHEKDQRRAVVHTVDVSHKYSRRAKEVVEGFRQGLYASDIEFHVGDVSPWIDEQVAKRGLEPKKETFLSHVILDMPAATDHFEKAAFVLHVNGSLLAFNPSITQIMGIVDMVKERHLPLQLERVLELGHNITGGREWDVRAVVPRARGTLGNEKAAGLGSTTEEGTPGNITENKSTECAEVQDGDEEESHILKQQGTRWKMVCRPKVGRKVVGGGFLGVWKKMRR